MREPAQDAVVETPEYRNSRRAFLVAMLMCGAVKPERLTERIVAEVEATGQLVQLPPEAR